MKCEWWNALSECGKRAMYCWRLSGGDAMRVCDKHAKLVATYGLTTFGPATRLKPTKSPKSV